MNGVDKSRIGPWRVLEERLVFDNAWISVVDYKVVQPGGRHGGYGVVKFKNRAVGVLPVSARGTVFLVGQHRFPLDAYSWELPEGGGSMEEAPIVTAKRELAEETGLSARQWLPLASFDLSNSVTDEAAECFLAWDLTEGAASPDETEDLALREISFSNLLEAVLNGGVRDSLTVVMTLAAHTKALRGELPEAISTLLLKQR